jgi:opacity protein-like surface antigen
MKNIYVLAFLLMTLTTAAQSRADTQGFEDYNRISCDFQGTGYGFQLERQGDGNFAGGWAYNFEGSSNLVCDSGAENTLVCTGTLSNGGGAPVHVQVTKDGSELTGSFKADATGILFPIGNDMPCKTTR